ncbi:hypothetical protein PENTCL1PPCAC_30876, partial [Pristionchus entomophagus]
VNYSHEQALLFLVSCVLYPPWHPLLILLRQFLLLVLGQLLICEERRRNVWIYQFQSTSRIQLPFTLQTSFVQRSLCAAQIPDLNRLQGQMDPSQLCEYHDVHIFVLKETSKICMVPSEQPYSYKFSVNIKNFYFFFQSNM